jgi:hypothetical protein
MSYPATPDTGADPVGDGTFRMHPSGDVVDLAERNARLAHCQRQGVKNCQDQAWADQQARQAVRRGAFLKP